jgi:hypothetical protein
MKIEVQKNPTFVITLSNDEALTMRYFLGGLSNEAIQDIFDDVEHSDKAIALTDELYDVLDAEVKK